MDVINYFQLPPNLPEFSLIEILLFIGAALLIMTVISSLSAFVASAPRSGFIRAFFAVLIHFMFTAAVIMIFIYMKQPPNGEVALIITFITATITYSTCFVSSIVKGSIIALIVGGLYFLVYKCTVLYLQMQYPDLYSVFMDAVINLSEHTGTNFTSFQ